MEEKQSTFQNRLTISQFGLAFLKRLPNELQAIKSNQDLQKQKNRSIIDHYNTHLMRGLDFSNFANETQNLIKRQKNCLLRVMKTNHSIEQSHHKYRRHYDNWVHKQSAAKRRATEVQAEISQNRFSEYDWQSNKQALKLKRKEILGDWETLEAKRRIRKLKDVRSNYNRTAK